MPGGKTESKLVDPDRLDPAMVETLHLILDGIKNASDPLRKYYTQIIKIRLNLKDK